MPYIIEKLVKEEARAIAENRPSLGLDKLKAKAIETFQKIESLQAEHIWYISRSQIPSRATWDLNDAGLRFLPCISSSSCI